MRREKKDVHEYLAKQIAISKGESEVTVQIRS